MIIYAVRFLDCNEGNCVEWTVSKAMAGKVRARIKREHIAEAKKIAADDDKYYGGPKRNFKNYLTIDFENIKISQEFFPNKKRDVATWLNTYLNRDNG